MMKLAFKRLLSYFPTRLPLGITEHEAWAASIIELAGLPDNDSMRFALSTSVLHVPQGRAFVPKKYFVNILIKGAANQVAAGVMQDLKQKQAEEQAKAAQATQETNPVADTTPATGDATNVTTPQ